ncbi:MAG: hypothetical protein LBJ25_03260 [Candidatus Margulisbacteria bacterium]|jgi:hypothetical protein|nr:hypothetical protein [Candidatus Margulisiibacteriota bacterium]
MLHRKIISQPPPNNMDSLRAAEFLRNFDFICAEKMYPLRERAKLVIQSLLTLGYVSPQEAAQLPLRSNTDKLNFWYHFFYNQHYIFAKMGLSMRAAFWRIIKEQLAVSPKTGIQNLQNIARGFFSGELNLFTEEMAILNYIRNSGLGYFTVSLYKHYTKLSPNHRQKFLQAVEAAQQAMLQDKPWSAVKQLLPAWGLQNKRERAFELLLQVMPWQTVFCAAWQARKIFHANIKRDLEMRRHLTWQFPQLTGKTLERRGRFYRPGKSIWHIPYGGLADICTADRPQILWRDPNFNLISIFDERAYLGFLQIVFQEIPGLGRCLVLYGSEPAASLLKTNSASGLYHEFISVCREFARAAGLSGVAQTACEAWFSNRLQLRVYIEDYVRTLPRIQLANKYQDYWTYRSDSVYLLADFSTEPR